MLEEIRKLLQQDFVVFGLRKALWPLQRIFGHRDSSCFAFDNVLLALYDP